jgi:hypothetical protein
MKNIQKLRTQYNKVSMELREAEEKEKNEILRPAIKKMVGKCFKYINSYGGDSKEWNLYVKIISVNEKTLSVNYIQFQRSSKDIVEIALKESFTYNGRNSFTDKMSYIPISNSEYNRAKKSLEKFVIEKLSI